MKVKELIKILKGYDEDKEVAIYSYSKEFWEEIDYDISIEEDWDDILIS